MVRLVRFAQCGGKTLHTFVSVILQIFSKTHSDERRLAGVEMTAGKDEVTAVSRFHYTVTFNIRSS